MHMKELSNGNDDINQIVEMREEEKKMCENESEVPQP